MVAGQGFSGANDSILSQFGVQALGVGVTIIYTAIVTWGLLKLTGLMTRGLAARCCAPLSHRVVSAFGLFSDINPEFIALSRFRRLQRWPLSCLKNGLTK